MKSRMFLAGIALAVFTPVVASAQEDGCRRDGNGRIIGTAVGAGAGGVLGNVIAGRGDKAEGSIIGAIVGAVIGNQVSKFHRWTRSKLVYKRDRVHLDRVECRTPPSRTIKALSHHVLSGRLSFSSLLIRASESLPTSRTPRARC